MLTTGSTSIAARMMGIGQEALWLIASVSLLVTIFVAVATGMQRNAILQQKIEAQKIEIELRKLIQEQTTTFAAVVSASRSSAEIEIKAVLREFHAMQIYIRDNFARRDSFYEVIGEVKQAVKDAVDEVKADVHRIEVSIDKRLGQFEDRLNKV